MGCHGGWWGARGEVPWWGARGGVSGLTRGGGQQGLGITLEDVSFHPVGCQCSPHGVIILTKSPKKQISKKLR